MALPRLGPWVGVSLKKTIVAGGNTDSVRVVNSNVDNARTYSRITWLANAPLKVRHHMLTARWYDWYRNVVMVGKKNLEVRPIAVNKGEIVKRILYLNPDTEFIFCAGDDKARYISI